MTDFWSAPPPSDLVTWASRRRQLGDTYGQQLAQLNFQRGNTLASQSLDTQDLATRWDRFRTQLPGGYAKRGLLNSGVYAGGLQDYGTDRARAFSRLAQQYQQGLGQLDLNQNFANQNYTGGMADVDAAEAARRAELASQIRGLG